MARVLALLTLLSLAACAPRLGPPYQDYEVRTDASDLVGRLREAAEAAGWTLTASPDSAIVSTEPREVAAGLGSRTEAALDLVPLDGGYVRVHVRAERRSFLGGRAKVYALDRDLRQAVLGPLSEALSDRGLVPLGTPRERDEDATE